MTYGSPTLRFTHRTARVTIVLTDYTEGLASVQLTGLSTEGDNPDIIVPYDKGSNTYTAIVAPQSVAAGTTFITSTFTNGKTFVYKMKNATDWQAGGEYTYTVSLAAAKDLGYTIESNGSYTVTSADGLMNVAELVNGGKTDINITLDKNIDLTGKGWTPIGTSFDNSYKGTFDGGVETIDLTDTSEEGIHRRHRDSFGRLFLRSRCLWHSKLSWCPIFLLPHRRHSAFPLLWQRSSIR